MINAPVLEMKELLKEYPGVRAVDRASMVLYPGEVHALVGENGAGKSTLIKILAGVVAPDAGEILFHGEAVEIKDGQDALRLGLSFIHQELNLVSYLDAAENIFLGKPYPTSRIGLVDWVALRARATTILERLKIEVPMDLPVGYLTPGQQSMIAIGRAFAGDASIYVMDEPTAALTEQEIQSLFKIILSLKEKGCTIVYVSHHLDEIFEIADRVTVMRDGKVVTTQKITDIDRSGLIQQMIGRELAEAYPPSAGQVGKPLLEVEGLTGGVARNISFTLHAGEILGVSGLVGSGRSEILRMLFGVDPIYGGKIQVGGVNFQPSRPADAIASGMALVPEERRSQGLITNRSVLENTTLVHLDSFTVGGVFIHKRQEQQASERVSKAVRLRAASLQQQVAQLSGGNQQKVVFAKWLLGNAKVLMLDEPTRGVDVGARFEIYKIIRQLAADGAGILLVSSDINELLGLADRMIVMREGEMVATVVVKLNLTQEEILTHYYGSDYDDSSGEN